MKILAIDTSTRFLCIAVYDDGRIYEYNLESCRQHSRLIILTIKRILDSLGWEPDDIDYYCCGTGPGSFMGLRIGIAAIKGLAWSLNKPVLAISSLDTLAKNADRDGIIMPAIDAKRKLIYCSVYKNKNCKLKRISPYILVSVEEFLKKAKAGSIILGDAIDLYTREFLSGIKGAVLLDKDYWRVQPHNMIYLALEQIKNKKIYSAFSIKANYLYPKECQISRGRACPVP